jgi:hypothetical protein
VSRWDAPAKKVRLRTERDETTAWTATPKAGRLSVATPTSIKRMGQGCQPLDRLRLQTTIGELLDAVGEPADSVLKVLQIG